MIKKAIKLLLRGRLCLVPVDRQEEVAITLNKNKTATLIYPDQKYLNKAPEGLLVRMISGFFLFDCLENPGKRFESWAKINIKTMKGKNK